MNNRTTLTLGLSALILGGATVGTATLQGGAAFASAPDARAVKQAAGDAGRARIALAQSKIGLAIGLAERAVRFSPQDASYRALLGNAYLKAGRFASARDAFTDSLTLAPADAPTALSLALAQTAAGDWVGARATLTDHADIIAVADRGLAFALAGDPDTGVDLLTVAARGPASDAKTRQNLALALALAGRWQESKTVAAVDVSVDELDKRMTQWAAFARPNTASDQVATLLGVKAVEDRGQPVAIALNAPARGQAVASAAVSAPVALVAATETMVAAPAMAVAPDNTMIAIAEVPSTGQTIVFGERKAVVQALPANYVAYAAKAKPASVRTEPAETVARAAPTAKVARAAPMVSPPVKPASGNFYVQLGAYATAAIAHDGWTSAQRRLPALGAHSPNGMAIKTAAGAFYRLSVGGFAKADAASLCGTYRARGGICFVRSGSGDQVASWVKPNQQLASR